jgi:hypothetical protein
MKITPAFRAYVRRVVKPAIAGNLDAVRTLGCIAIALRAE